MTLDEFTQQIGLLGYIVEIDGDEIVVLGKKAHVLLSVTRYSMYEVNTQWSDFEKLSNDIKAELLRLGNALASTSVEFRVEEEEIPKRYYLKLPSTIGSLKLIEELSYLNCNKSDGDFMFNSCYEDGFYTTIYTQDEIDKLGLHWLTKEEVE